jgi:predicted metal-binding membrane protein
MILWADRRPTFTVVLGALILLAWVALWSWGQSPYGGYLDHQRLDEVGRGDYALLLVVAGGWTLMTLAMMLPTSLPLITLFRAVASRRADGRWLMALLILGYLAIWLLFGLLVHAADAVIHAGVRQSAWLQAHAWLLGGATLVAVGIYQFTPLKRVCLDRCRAPRSFIMAHWRGQHERRSALWLGLHHGLYCVGCCWALMLLMFAVGVGNVGWMLGLGALMAIEKNHPQGKRLSAPLGIGLVAWGLLVALRPALG